MIHRLISGAISIGFLAVVMLIPPPRRIMARMTPAPPIGSCWECGYLLRGLETHRCPECGRPFDPDDESTMNMGLDVPRLTRFWMSPPGWMMNLLICLAVLISLWGTSTPIRPGYFLSELLHSVFFQSRWDDFRYDWHDFREAKAHFMLAVYAWLIVGILWITRRVMRGLTVKRLSRQRAAPMAYWRRWLLGPVIFGATILLCNTSLPVRLGFLTAKPALEQIAQNPGRAPGMRLGVYPQSYAIDRFPGLGPPETLVYLDWTGGFARLSTPREEKGDLVFRHLAGNWYYFYRR